MIFREGVKQENLHDWKYFGVAEDKDGSYWSFYTDKLSEFERFKKVGYTMGFRFVDGKKNEYFETMKKLSG